MISKDIARLSANQALKECFKSLRSKIIDNFNNNPSIHYIPSSEHFVKDKQHPNIEFNVKILESFNNKPEGKKETFHSEVGKDSSSVSQDKKDQKDPFLAPFEDGQYIDDLFEDHCLLYNKYCVCDYHTLVVTKDFQKQTDSPNFKDFKACLLPIKVMNAMLFFNGGFNSGASVLHKHFQLIPYSSFPNQSLPIEDFALSSTSYVRNDNKMFMLDEFNFQHVFYKLDDAMFDKIETIEDMDQIAEKLEQYFWQCQDFLDNKDHLLENSYNMLVTKQFMIIVMRQQDSVKIDEISLSVNSLGFAGTLAVKNDSQLELVNKVGPLKVLELVSRPRL